MMRTRTGLLVVTLLSILVVSAGCSGLAPVSPPAPPTAVANSSQSAAASPGQSAGAAAQVAAGQPQPAATPDTAAIQAAVLQAVEDRLAAVEPTALAQMVQQAVDVRLATPVSDTLQGRHELSDLEAALVDVYHRANPSVVYIIVPLLGSGSGFVYSDNGYIVTNNHVVDGGRDYEIVFANGDHKSADLVGSDADADLAVLKVDKLPDGVTALPLADPDSLQVGQFVIAIGNPFGEQGSMSMGIVSGLNRSLRSQRGQRAATAYSLPSVIQTDAPINPGNSGGPLLNLDGEVVGVNSAIASITGVNSGVGFSIPVIAVQRIVPSLIENGSYTYGYLGASFADELSLSDQEQLGLSQVQGAYVLGVAEDGPAQQAGLVAANPDTGRGGDLVVKLDETPVRNFSDLNAYMVFHAAPGQTVDVTVLRNGKEVVLPLILAERP